MSRRNVILMWAIVLLWPAWAAFMFALPSIQPRPPMMAPAPMPRPTPAASPAVLFSPHGGCTERVVKEVDAARKEVRVQAYNFTSRPIADALLRARARGVDVAIILDHRANESNPLGPELAGKGAEVTFDASHPISHNKLILIDGRTVIGGSFNYSANAESNAENLTVAADPALAAVYLANWQLHRGHSAPASPKAPP